MALSITPTGQIVNTSLNELRNALLGPDNLSGRYLTSTFTPAPPPPAVAPPQPTVPTPVATMGDGTVLLSDGTRRIPTINFDLTGLSTNNTGTPTPRTGVSQNIVDELNEVQRRQMEQARAAFAVLPQGAFEAPSYEQYVAGFDAAMKDPKIVKYYSDLLNNAQGDYNEAIKRLEEDYQRGTRIIRETTGLGERKIGEELTASLRSLGVTSLAEQEALQAQLNKRGIGVVQEGAPGRIRAAQAEMPTFDEQGNVRYMGTEGRAGVELGQLRADQQLRREAIQRTARFGTEELGLRSGAELEKAGLEKMRGAYDTTRELQREKVRLGEAQQAQASQLAQQKMSFEQQQRSLDIAKAQYEAQKKALGIDQQ